MREILFRGKTTENRWVEGAYFKHDTVKVCFSSDDPKPRHLIIQDGFCDWGFEPPIGGVEFEVKYGPNIRIGNDLCYGMFKGDDSEIWLSTTDGTEHQRRCQTLWHEILHGIRAHAGLVIENEEEVVEMFAKGIYQVLQDNGARLFDLKEAADG